MSKNAKTSHRSPISNFLPSQTKTSKKDSENREMELGKFLGVDFGKSKIGLAVADSETRIAFAYGTLKNDKDLFTKITEIIEKERINKVIIGSEGNNFGESLKNKLNLPVEFQNEIFSTQMAERGLKEKGLKKIKRFDDREAARIILQSWLDKKDRVLGRS